MSEDDFGYDASHIEVLEGLEAIRRRPGMYVGSTDERGLHHLVFEIAGRAVNEVLAGRAESVDVTFTADGSVRVRDDGPGVPFEADGDSGTPGLEDQLTHPYVGARPDSRHVVDTDLFGVGPCVVNALSSRLTAEVRRGGIRWVQEYARGVAVTPPTAAGPATDSGTTIAFWPDTGIFGTSVCSFAALAQRFKELAFLNRGLCVSLTDERLPSGARSVRFRSPGGARDFVAFLDAAALDCTIDTPVHPDVIGFEHEDPRMAGTVEVALRWHGSPEERLVSFANSRPTPNGGTHVAGFRDGVTAAIDDYVRERGLSTPTGPDLGSDLSPDRTCAGLTAVVSVKLDRPEFRGATHGELGGTAVRDCVAQAVREHLLGWLEEHPEQAAALVGRVVRGVRRD
ncbi:DNA gyrase subunit B [Streptomyces sp. NPDC002265]|uniref:DNA gyrase subunit B n=1 Tax=Streptomyces sp. NPDC002265 TaxID=3154415 RepID=UPI003320D1D7